jgi:hypothetical protein
MILKGKELEKVKEYARTKAVEKGLDPELFIGQLATESAWNTEAASPAGAKGLAQFMPETAKQYKLTNPFDPLASVSAAADYMSVLKKRYNGNEDLARQAYNWGEGNLDKFLAGKKTMPAETKKYNESVYKKAGVKGASPSLAQAPAPDKLATLSSLAEQEMDTGAPVGGLISQQLAKDSWQEALGQQTQGVTPPKLPSADFYTAGLEDSLQTAVDEGGVVDAAASQQNAMLSKMFDAELPDETGQAMLSSLPKSIDNYLQKILDS